MTDVRVTPHKCPVCLGIGNDCIPACDGGLVWSREEIETVEAPSRFASEAVAEGTLMLDGVAAIAARQMALDKLNIQDDVAKVGDVQEALGEVALAALVETLREENVGLRQMKVSQNIFLVEMRKEKHRRQKLLNAYRELRSAHAPGCRWLLQADADCSCLLQKLWSEYIMPGPVETSEEGIGANDPDVVDDE